jgi:hypothetical protein
MVLASLRGTPIYVVMAMKKHRKEVKETWGNQTGSTEWTLISCQDNVGSQAIQQDT